MPELAEYKISADFINLNSKNKFIKAFHVQKGNIPVDFEEKYNMTNFSIKAKPNGKDLILEIKKEDEILLNCGIGTGKTSREAVSLATKSLDTIREIRDSGKEKPEVYELKC